MLAFLAVGCSKSDDGQTDDNNGINPSVDANYTIISEEGSNLTANLLNANLESITISPERSSFNAAGVPSHSFRSGMEFSYFQNTTDCSGTLHKFNFDNNQTQELAVFEDLADCNLEVNAIAHNESTYFVAFSMPQIGMDPASHAIRILDASGSPSFMDVAIDKQPIGITYAKNRLFILARDMVADGANALYTLDLDSNSFISEINLPAGATQISTKTKQDVLISYPELHLIVNSSTLNVDATVRYIEGVEPGFANSDTMYFDNEDKLYFLRPTQESDNSQYASLPTIFDFSVNTAYIYVYEQFLSDTQRTVEFNIGNSSAVSYDEKNNLLLIGYTKANNNTKGGLLRVLLSSPQPKFVDNIDLDGVPKKIFVQ